ncbi:MAG: sulfite exporter TauE/SafE family protein [Proteobacteria bacterium]|nr:sulfite exporter TauE/SafE family protein [Pseudomonadota bacterium]
MLQISAWVLLGLTAGVASGLVGVGGGIVLVPAMVFFFGLTQHQAQGTSLAVLVPPIGILAAWTYYRQGYVQPRMALFICLGFVLGGLLGARLATQLSNPTLTRVFGAVLTAIGVKMLLF